MKAAYNRVIVCGNLTRAVELRSLASGTAVAEIGLAVNDRVKNAAGEWIDQATFIDVTLWGRWAEVASEYLCKGSAVLIEGRLKLDTWEKDGQKRSKLKVVGERLVLLGDKQQGDGSNQRPAAQTPRPTPPPAQQQRAVEAQAEVPDDIPF